MSIIETLLKKQKGYCAICLREIDPSIFRSVNLDLDERSGRGQLLCYRCYRSVRKFRESLDPTVPKHGPIESLKAK
jgi:hypothetical protein